MLDFDTSKNILYAYSNKIARPNLCPNVINDNRQSYLDYLANQITADVDEYFMPALVSMCGTTQDMLYRIGNVNCVEMEIAGVRHLCVKVKLHVARYEDKDAQELIIMQIPIVDKTEGFLTKEGKEYAFINMLEQTSCISYEKADKTSQASKIKIKHGSRYILIEDAGKGPKLILSDISGTNAPKKFELLPALMAMCSYEGFDVKKVWYEFSSYTITNRYTTEDKLYNMIYYYGGNNNSINAEEYINAVVPRLTLSRLTQNGVGDLSYDSSDIRNELNKILALDRSVGEILSRNVVTKDGTILAYAGTVIDNLLVDTMKANGIYVVYVMHVPNIVGFRLTDTVIINTVPRGLRIPEKYRSHFPNEYGMYLSEDITSLKDPIILEEGTIIDNDILGLLVDTYQPHVDVKDNSSNTVQSTRVNFEEEIISNRQVKGSYISKDPNKWYYLDSSDEYIETTGKYTAYDLVALYSFVNKLFTGKWVDFISNSDLGFRKKLINVKEQYHRAFKFACNYASKRSRRSFGDCWKSHPEKYHVADEIENSFYPFTVGFWNYLYSEVKCVNLLSGDEVTNPIAYQSALTKVNVYTANKHSVAESQRNIAIGSYGKIDPYEIPQSGKMGTVYNRCCNLNVDSNGVMRTPYYAIVGSGNDLRVDSSREVLLTAEDEEQYVIADISSISMDSSGKITDPDKIVLCRVPESSEIDKQTFANRQVKFVQYVNTCANTPLSWATATIPHACNNDAARAIFAVGQEKQAKGIINPEEPDVMTSAYEQFSYLNTRFGIRAEDDGVVESLTKFNNNDQVVELFIKYDHHVKDDGLSIKLNTYIDSGVSVTKLKFNFKPGQRFKKGDMIVSSNFISERGILQFGVNALTAYICDKYNYEDASHISESLAYRLSSYRINPGKYEESPRNTMAFDIDSPKRFRYLSKEFNDSMIASYSSSSGGAGRQSKRYQLTKEYGFYLGRKPIKTSGKGSGRVRAYGSEVSYLSIDKNKLGDKTSNRHGNKGVLSERSDPSKDYDPNGDNQLHMPMLMNGMPIEICLNPAGVASRMNIGQIKEAHCGLIAHVLGIKISTDAYNGISDEEIFKLMSFTVDVMNSTGDPRGACANHKDIPESLKTFACSNIDNIRLYAGCFDKEGTTKLILTDSNGRLTETRVLIGYTYIFKLIQESDKKLHYRGNEITGEPYSEVSNAPTKGASRHGGQRFGHMEIQALSAHGASHLIQEITNQRCDNSAARSKLYTDTYVPTAAKSSVSLDNVGQRRSTTQFLYTMLALGLVVEPENNEFYPVSSSNAEDLKSVSAEAIRKAYVMRKKKTTEEIPNKPDVGQVSSFDDAINILSGGRVPASPTNSVIDGIINNII